MAQRTNIAQSRKKTACIVPKPRPLASVAQLAERGLLPGEPTDNLNTVAERFSIAVTPALADLIDKSDPADPIARQFIPHELELEANAQDRPDPIGDARHSPVNGIIHRYPDRLLLLPIRVCAVYCRFCFRREAVGSNESSALNQDELDTALEYIRSHKEVWEVILSGGDPLLLSPRRLHKILQDLSRIEHVRVIRIHTRMPVADPERINAELVESLCIDKPVFVLVHTNHVRELTPACLQACQKLTDAGLSLLSQSVLLKGVNDDADTLERLFRKLVENRIKPYYLHHCDRAAGTAHFRTTLAEGRSIMRQLRGRLSGLCLPEYVLDIPGGHGKVPVGPVWLNDENRVTDYRGETHDYSEPT